MFTMVFPFYLTNLLELYSGVFEYNIGNVDGTAGQILLIIFNFTSAFVGGHVYDLKLSETLTFLPSFITRDFVYRDCVMVLIAYSGLIYVAILIWH